jgi:hypothetical protein
VFRAVFHAIKTTAFAAALLFSLSFMSWATGSAIFALAPLILFSAIPLTLLKLKIAARDRFLLETVDRQLPPARLLRD